MKAYRGKGVRILLDVVRDGAGPELPGDVIRAAGGVVRAWQLLQANGLVPREREAFGVLLLNARHRPIGFQVVAVGTLNSAPIHPREVFRAAVVAGAHAIVVAHNHPTGDPTPSPEDDRITDRLTRAGELLGILLLDHVIIGGTHFHSSADGRRYPLPDPYHVSGDVDEP